MAKTAKQIFESIKENIGNPLNIKDISKPSYGSPHPDCDASFFIYMKEGGDHHINTSSIKKANVVVDLLNEWIGKK